MSIKLHAATIIVAQNGSGDYVTIQGAAYVAQAGDTIFIKQGIYHETVYVSNSGSPGSPIVFLGDSLGEVIIDGQNGALDYCLRILGKSNLVFKRIHFKGAYWYGVDFKGPASDVTFDEVEVSENIHPTDDWSYGLVIAGTTGTIENVKILNCNIHDNRSHGLYIVDDVRNVLVDQCHIHHNGNTFNDVADNITVADWDNAENGPDGIEIRNCEIDNATRQGISTWFAKNIWVHHCHLHHNGATGIQIEDGVKNFVLENNISEWNQLHYNTETGIWIDDAYNGIIQDNIIRHNQVGVKISKSDRVILRNNFIYKNYRENPQHFHNGGILVLSYDSINNKNTAIVHNSCDQIGKPEYENFMIGFYSNTGIIDSVYVKNNIFSNLQNGDEVFTSFTSIPPSFYSDYNNFYNTDSLSAYWNTNITWQQYLAKSLDANSILSNPSFIDTTLNNYQLSNSSQCIDNGTCLAYTVGSGSGSVIEVDNAIFFSDGINLIDGDSIMIGNVTARIIGIDYLNNSITIDTAISWNDSTCANYVYYNNAPDIGAHEKYYSSSGREGNRFSDKTGFRVYPNPFSNYTQIKKPKSIKNFGYKIYNLTGKLIVQKSNIDSEIHILEKGSFKNGLYILIIESGNSIERLKFVVN